MPDFNVSTTTIATLAWLLAICSGLMAGTYFAFSGFIMRSFATLEAPYAVAAMNRINVTILRTAFMPLFFGSTVIALVMAITGVWRWGEAGTGLAVATGLIYTAGMFGVTATANVPLNNALARVRGDEAEAEQIWADYLARWTRWNTVRSVASLVTLVLCFELLGV